MKSSVQLLNGLAYKKYKSIGPFLELIALSALLAVINLDWKGQLGTNTLAYLATRQLIFFLVCAKSIKCYVCAKLGSRPKIFQKKVEGFFSMEISTHLIDTIDQPGPVL